MFSAANENTLALANLKFDFSLLKVEAPTEFKGLGKALSQRRKFEAEDGSQHKTARKLAALFDQLVPSTPELIKAYGLRSSEIIQMNAINPVGSPNDGPFESFVGADGTAMWAAATSGVSALGIYLLACLLARAWDAKEATSLWVELIEQRRKEIEHGLENHHSISEASRFSIFQDIQRSDLARWDASARAWLQSADQAKQKEQTQLMLILKNVQLPFDGGASTYSKVINAWSHAMSGLENLLCGRPQDISSRAVLLAFSAWHLYPDLIVLGKEVTKISFKDRCVNPRGVGTISLRPRSDSSYEGTRWSLALSHLQYYGDPITVESRTDFSRVSIDQLHIVALGSLFSQWDVRQCDLSAAAQWLVDLWDILSVSGEDSALTAIEGLEWLQDLARAATQVVSARIDERQEALQLLKYGQRRAKRFLDVPGKHLAPFFGLTYAPVLAGLSQEDNEKRGLVFLRTLAKVSGCRPCDALIGIIKPKRLESSSEIVGGIENTRWALCEYTTAVAHCCATKKQNLDGDILHEDVHVRWRHVIALKESIASVADSKTLLPLGDSDSGLSSIHEWETVPEERIHRFADINPPRLEKRKLIWRNAPALFDEPQDVQSTEPCKVCLGESCCGRPRLPRGSLDASDIKFPQDTRDTKFKLSTKIGDFSLYCKPSVKSHADQRWTAGKSSEQLRTAQIKPQVLAAYLSYLVNPMTQEHAHISVDSELDYIRVIATCFETGRQTVDALRALSFASQVYRQLDGASISLKVVSSPLAAAPWFEFSLRKTLFGLNDIGGELFPVLAPQRIPRENAFSCIAHFESGSLSLPPEDFGDTLAIASGNSIFVISEVVSDPFDSIDKSHVKRLVGNIGQPGISMLIAPKNPRIRALAEEYNVVSHLAYDGKRENNFEGTSLHLSFTDWKIPLGNPGATTRTIDQDAYFIESVISVLDSGRWVADLDILCIDFKRLLKIESKGTCPVH